MLYLGVFGGVYQHASISCYLVLSTMRGSREVVGMLRSFYAMTMPGLETLAFSEIRAKMPDAELVKFARGITLFRTGTPTGDLLQLRTVEDVFITIAHITGLGRGRDAVRVFHSAMLNVEDMNGTLSVWRRAHKAIQPKTWRVVSQMVGTHDFRRTDAGQAVSDGLRRVMPRGMRLVDDEADIEFWLWVGGSEALVGLRVGDATMRHRTYKREHLPASLRPTIAASMSWLARPTPDDSVLDPLCGAGTVIIERALLAPFHSVSGGDIREEAVAMATRNARAAHVKATWSKWDARSLPLDDASVSRIITNLPFGKQIGTPEENVSLYTALAQEFKRVTTKDGLQVALTSDDRVWEDALRNAGLQVTKKVVIVVLGQPATIFVAEPAK